MSWNAYKAGYSLCLVYKENIITYIVMSFEEIYHNAVLTFQTFLFLESPTTNHLSFLVISIKKNKGGYFL